MFERFTDRARTVVVLAQEEARTLGHGHIGTEHLLLGLIAEPTGVASVSLDELGYSLDGIRAAVGAALGHSTATSPGRIPFAPRAKKVLELSLREALQLGHNYIGTEHILLGLLAEGEGLGAQILAAGGPGLDAVRAAVMQKLQTPAPAPGRPGFRGPRSWGFLGGTIGALRTPAEPPTWPQTAAAAGVHWKARASAGEAPVGTDDLLRALAGAEGSVAGKVFERLGITPEQLVGALDATSRAGTTDAPPPLPAQSVSVREEDGKLVIEVAGEGIDAMRDAMLQWLREVGGHPPGAGAPPTSP
jgi:hypothetical protein